MNLRKNDNMRGKGYTLHIFIINKKLSCFYSYTLSIIFHVYQYIYIYIRGHVLAEEIYASRGHSSHDGGESSGQRGTAHQSMEEEGECLD